ncbi:plasma-membrane choline transporter-domain-containing protein [Lineolata rhizophorae]|uniref:Protein PNS1 n=1 Tax=Lineolata rhizophorae TaxID=578093 RepID=A0A6A6NTH5_9PEZI|nr:plasma-membrane choline transporter-domain-containing protein [Lineolata rhizophorae]
MASGGEASSYYNAGSQQPNYQYQQSQPNYGQYPPPQHGGDDPAKYGQEPPQYDHQGYGPYGYQPEGEKHSFDETFRIEKPKWNDLWAGILVSLGDGYEIGEITGGIRNLIIVFAGYVVVSGIAIQGYASTKGFNGGGIYDGSNTFSLDTNTLVLFVFVLVVSFVLSYAYVWLARLFPKAFIWVTGILNIIFGFATAIYMLSRKYYSGGIVFLLFAIFTLICFITWIKRIPFSALMLRTAVDVSKSYGHVYLVSLAGGIVAIAFGAWYSVTLVAIYVKYQPAADNPACSEGVGGCSQAKVIGLIVFVTFAMYWISEWIKNTIHTTIAGVYGSWYFCSANPPKGATRGALKRATTYSFGSISLGSLIVAIINMLRQVCSVAQRAEAAEGNIVGTILFCVLGCIIGILDWAVQFLNRYAFCHIALYGKSYVAAAKDTWRMIKDRGIDALINELLIGPVLSMGAVFVAFACALMAYCYLIFTSPAYNSDGDYTPVVVAFAFLIGLQVCNIFTTPISSGIETIFVASAWDPEVLVRDHPDLYARMVSVYPRVQTAIHS